MNPKTLPPLWPDTYDRIIDALHDRLKPKRFVHVLGVLETAVSLAHSHGIDPERVAWTALMHDHCKGGEEASLKQMAEDLGEAVPDEDVDYPGIWHAWAAAGLAAREYGVTDEEILEAIRHHSTGHPAMSNVAKVLFLADHLEPTRGFPSDELLRTAHKNLDEAVIAVLQAKISHLRDRGQNVHPRAVQTLAALTQVNQEV